MFHRETPPAPRADEPQVAAREIDQARLRATLRLIFDGATADQIVAEAGSASTDLVVNRVMRAATWQWRLILLRDRLRRRDTGSSKDPPLVPRRGLPGRSMVALALHLGLGLTVETLAEATNSCPDQLGTDLYQARLRLEPTLHPGCGDFISSIGRYRDRSLDINRRASLIQHAQRCDACRAVLDWFEAIDARLLDQIDQEVLALASEPEPSGARRRVSRRRRLTLVAGLLLVAIVGAGLFGIATRLVQPHNSSNSTATNANQQLDGWLLTKDYNGSMTALNLSSGQKRRLAGPVPPSYMPAAAALSPDKRLIANQVGITSQVGTANPDLYQQLTIETVTGQTIKTIRLNAMYAAFSGWLGNDTVLEISYPPAESGESQDAYIARMQKETVLTAVDVASGNQRKIFRGAVSQVYPSPDATMVGIDTSFVQTDQLRSIELRPVQNGQVGNPITTINDSKYAEPFWSHDSNRLYLGVATASPATPTTSSGTPSPVSNLFTSQIRSAYVDRTGALTQLPDLPGGEPNVPIDTSPDGKRLYMESMGAIGESGNPTNLRLWQTTPSGTDPRQVTDLSADWIAKGVWSPDGATMLAVRQQIFFLLPATDDSALGKIPVTSFIAVGPDGTSFTAMNRMSGTLGTNVVGWLPPDTFPDLATSGPPSRLSQPAPVELKQPGLSIDAASQASPDGQFTLLTDSRANLPVVWSQATASGRNLPTGTHDLSWFPDSPLLIGVGNSPVNQPDGPSRLTTFAPTFEVTQPAYDYRVFDPAAIGSSTETQYASPLISPDESALAFFVTDARTGSTALWLASDAKQSEFVYGWTTPRGSKINPLPVASWIDDHTLLFAAPEDWQNGLPGEVKIDRLTVAADGNAKIDIAATLHTHGTEHGIALEELAVNQLSGRVAYRLRHFARASATDGVSDTIEITSVNKIADAIEVSRAGPASGLDWSPDGQTLAAVTPHELDFFSGSGTKREELTNLANPSDPRWIKPNEIWYSDTNDQGDRVMSVQLQ